MAGSRKASLKTCLWDTCWLPTNMNLDLWEEELIGAKIPGQNQANWWIQGTDTSAAGIIVNRD